MGLPSTFAGKVRPGVLLGSNPGAVQDFTMPGYWADTQLSLACGTACLEPDLTSAKPEWKPDDVFELLKYVLKINLG